MKISDLIALSGLEFVTELDQIKAEIDAHRPLPKETEERIMQKLRLDWNYHSNAIEGNQLDYGETVAFLMHGITAKGKTLKDHLDIKGHDQAIKFLWNIVKDERGFSETDIRSLHKMILIEPYETDAITLEGLPTKKLITIGEYKKTPNHVETRTGEIHYFASPEETPIKMAELMAWYNEAKGNSDVHPLVLATVFHHEFVAIHPFDDGNGRMGRILMNLILLQKNFPVIVVKKDDRNNYYGVLSQADNGRYIPLVQYMAEHLKHSLDIYLKAIRGEEIEEKDDIDKEIALFKQSFDSKIITKDYKTDETVKIFGNDVIAPLINYLILKLEKFNDLFLQNNMVYNFSFLDNLNRVSKTAMPIFDNAQFIAALNKSVSKFEFTYFYKNLKNVDKNISVNVSITVMFQDKIVEIYLEGKLLKGYNQKWEINEMERLVNDRIIKRLMQKISQENTL